VIFPAAFASPAGVPDAEGVMCCLSSPLPLGKVGARSARVGDFDLSQINILTSPLPSGERERTAFAARSAIQLSPYLVPPSSTAC